MLFGFCDLGLAALGGGLLLDPRPDRGLNPKAAALADNSN